MAVSTSNAVFVFFPLTDRLNSDPLLMKDALNVREQLAAGHPGSKEPVQLQACSDAALVPVDGLGRTLPGIVTGDGLIGRDLWRRFAAAEHTPAIDEQLWSRSGQGRRAIRTVRPRLSVQSRALDEAKARWLIKLSLPTRAPDPLSELATERLNRGAIPMIPRWPAPFGRLFPGPASLEALVDQARLRKVVALATKGAAREALALAETVLEQRHYDVTVPSLGAFWQIAREHDGEFAVLVDAEFGLGVKAPDWEALAHDPAFLKRVRVPTRVPYLLGFLGYIWWQVVQELGEGHLPRACEACGALLPEGATARRRYCSGNENPLCWRRRHRARMRRHRTSV